MPRTTVYRLLEKMRERGVVEEVIGEKKTRAKAVGVNRIKLLVKQKVEEEGRLQTLFPHLESALTQKQTLQQPATKVLFYRGVEGVKQMVWDVLKAENEAVGYTDTYLAGSLWKKFMGEWREEFIRRRLVFRDIISNHYLRNEAAKEELSAYS